MLIDDIIMQMEILESKAELDSNVLSVIKHDVYYGVPSLLFELSQVSIEGLSWKEDEAFRRHIVRLNDKIARLILIVRRLRDATKCPRPELLYTKTFKYAEIDAEFFFHQSYSILTSLARLTQFLYRPHPKYLSFDSFQLHRRFFINPNLKCNHKLIDFEYRRNIDPDYSEYLAKKTSWFDRFITYQSRITPTHSPIITPLHNRLYLRIHGRGKGFDFLPIPEYVNDATSQLLDLVCFYNEHYSQKFPSK